MEAFFGLASLHNRENSTNTFVGGVAHTKHNGVVVLIKRGVAGPRLIIMLLDLDGIEIDDRNYHGNDYAPTVDVTVSEAFQGPNPDCWREYYYCN